MNKKQYNNVIEHTLKHEVSAQTDSLETARAIFNNMGIALPQGDIKHVYEVVQSDDYMGWKSCTMQEAQEAANNGTAAIGISEDKIVVFAANDEEEPVAETASIMTLSENTSAYAVDGLSYATYSNGTTGQGSNVDIGNYKDRYTYELVKTFDFTDEVAKLIRLLYDKIDKVFGAESNLLRAWRCSRLLGGIVYSDNSLGSGSKFEWNDVAGQAFSGTEENYFVNTLGYTNSEYTKIKNAIKDQYKNGTAHDFAHMQITLSARLAYTLDLDGDASNIYTLLSDEDVSHLAGWLGDATLRNKDGVTTFGNDDYCADLDAENIYRKIIQGYSSVSAINSYYSNLSTSSNRADVFLKYISFSTVKKKVFYELIDRNLSFSINTAAQQGNTYLVDYYTELMNDEQYHWNTIKNSCPDTYDFLKSLQNRRAIIVNY